MIAVKIADLIIDYDIYPRESIDSTHVHYIAEAMRAGQEMPPIVIQQKSKRIVDGVHRWRAMKRLHDDTDEIDVVAKKYKTELALYQDAVRYNLTHGHTLTRHDRTRVALKLQRDFKLEPDEIAESLNLTSESVNVLLTDKTAQAKLEPIAIKNTIRHMAGRKFSRKQEEANKRLSGMNQIFYVNQVITLLETPGFLKRDDEKLMKRLEELHEELGKLFVNA